MSFTLILKNKAKKVLQLAAAKNLKIALAESCTGGLLSALLTEISGASKVFNCAFVTYSNKAKIEMLQVKKETLEKFGAVSKETALEMVKGVIKNSGADIGIAITGIAGPNSTSKKKPVGLVYIGFCLQKRKLVKKFNFAGNRAQIRKCCLAAAIEIVETELKKMADRF
jgi:PncC family amidohydrolase